MRTEPGPGPEPGGGKGRTGAVVLAFGLVAAFVIVGWWSTNPSGSAAPPRGGYSDPLGGPGGALPQQAGLEGAALAEALHEWSTLYEPRGWLDAAGTAALKAERDAAAARIVAGIGAADPGSMAAILERWRSAGAREQLLLIEGVARNPSREGVETLEAMYTSCAARRVCEEVLSALGASEGAGNTELLAQVLEGEDERAAQVAAMALHGEAAAEDGLTAVIYGEQPIEVRLEAVHSLAGIGTPSAHGALGDAAQSEALEARVRAYAAKELERAGVR